MSNYFSRKKASEMLGVCTKTLHRYEEARKFVPEIYTTGGHARYSKEQINNLIKKFNRHKKFRPYYKLSKVK